MSKNPLFKRSKRIILLTLFVLIMTVFVSSLGAASDPAIDSYIVVMELDPLISYEGDIQGMAATKPDAGQQFDAASPDVEVYQDFLRASHDVSLTAAGASVHQKVNEYTVALNGYSALLTEEQAKEVENQAGVAFVMEDELRQATTDSSPEFLGLTGRGSAWAAGLTGEGVVVGIIDSGIWPEHPSFADDGSYSPPAILPLDDSRPACEFGNTIHNANDVPFTCNNKLLGARQMLDTYRALIGADPDEFDSARDDNGHGTHTASTAAGNADVHASIFGIPRGEISGIAPRAHIIAYKGLGNLGGFTSDLASAIDQAVADGVDVINYSIGGGASAPTGADDIAFLFAADAGVFAATSAGNSGPGSDTVGSPGNAPWLTTVGASTQERFFKSRVILYGARNIYGASITHGTRRLPIVDAEDAGDDLCNPGALDPAVVEGKIVLCRRGAIARADKSLAVYQAGGAGMILYNNTDDDNLFTDNHWVPSVHVNNTDGLAIKAYIDNKRYPRVRISVSRPRDIDAPSITYFSSRGVNGPVPDIIKPDITAPGHQILAGNSPYPIGGVQGELFQSISGTSMSSPHIAGIYALMKQAHPDWSPAAAKSAIMTTAYQDVKKDDRVTPADPFDMGAGHVDPGNPDRKGSAFDPGLVYDAGLLEYVAFTCGADLGVFTPGSCTYVEGLGIPSDASDLNMASIGIAELAGTQTVVRTVTSVADTTETYRVSVDAPPGYDVTVTPSTLTLLPGDVASYEVTIANNGGGVVGEWAFGSLTWKSDSGRPWHFKHYNHFGHHYGRSSEYEVYSPIAVNAALFDAPPQVTGEGASGSASFDVNFGYTGDYTVAPHGLTADAQTNDTISQDPDQTYPSDDDDAGGVDKIDFPISGAAFVRWSLVIPGDDDIDLFLEDSSGNIVASSTNGGTDETIELFLPADDTYTMVVHGWSVPNEPLPYTLHFWEVPLASGGSLSVDNAPASATLATTGTIDVSWTGLASDTTYLGAVSHADSGGLLGLTLVEVDVP
jgi:subtilisin family serine protease